MGYNLSDYEFAESDEKSEKHVVDAQRENRAEILESQDPADMYMCPNGHLQYNLSARARVLREQQGGRQRPMVYEQSPCIHCAEPLSKLTSDPLELQHKLATQTMAVTQLQLQSIPLLAVKKDMDEIALFLRDKYAYEINEGKVWHTGSGARAVIHYLEIERNRLSVRLVRSWRALLRFIGA